MKKQTVRVFIDNEQDAKPHLINWLTVQVIKRFEPSFNEYETVQPEPIYYEI